ncbi:STIP1 homology and U box-containing protein 1 [Eufriesea mexicana]|uniref:E3 ubiquitin-protein ligase CHIP n=1 Tax=Eufriesea mexicana TaxID=516756 RepID=A0A310SH73_9HYME|nr:PREDICTED: E3 ubiquitin-protein ligase CHIP [Eufriesea mexicana]XP_017763279.1 PREDICTED: E3 ubiquitin-protein ligase CHIP [Eufriesea mexicana]XP_017763287.1 PREDICTED: E3 ubiquitin-protein ligase CHIP [Eufriesea mexicana]XP_017763294.1 PREDICTED: E3 ubiquitin-protein ligase CHIP [Eufriesea mexicana]OAD61950.1 STIP1 homology and U box-containing protein 1 [Eufriesea mexicana]
MSKMYTTANLSDKELKEEGNRLFNLHKYEDAAYCYTKAIIKNPTQALYFTNRALCNLKLKRWESSCLDCRRALDIDPCLVKGHFFLGLALLEMEHIDEAVKRLQRAVDLAKEQKLNYGDDMTSILRQARKRCFQLKEEQRIIQDIELQSYLNQLIVEDAERSLAELMEQEGAKDADGATEGETSSIEFMRKKEEIEEKRDTYMAHLNDLFAKVDERRRKREVPDYLCGKISFEILQEPVITPSGITYERKDIEEHLQRVGHFDPVTRVRLTQDQLIPNLAMKEVVDTFLQENEWALYY